MSPTFTGKNSQELCQLRLTRVSGSSSSTGTLELSALSRVESDLMSCFHEIDESSHDFWKLLWKLSSQSNVMAARISALPIECRGRVKHVRCSYNSASRRNSCRCFVVSAGIGVGNRCGYIVAIGFTVEV